MNSIFLRLAKVWFRPSESQLALIESFTRLPLSGQLTEIIRFIRGLWLSRKLENRGFIRASRSVKISKRNGRIYMDRYFHIWEGAQIAVVGKEGEASLSIGFGAGIGAHTQINVTKSITIGKGTFIGWHCDIMDSNFHRVFWLDREPAPVSQPIVLEDHVFVGAHTIILAGVTIGANSVVGAGSVVTKSIPPNSFAAGVPARVITKIKGWDPNPYPEEDPESISE